MRLDKKKAAWCLASKGVLVFLLLVVSEATNAQAVSPAWPEEVAAAYRVYPNIVYRTANNSDLKLDLYLPRGGSTPVPLLLYFHGGGWVEGTKEGSALQFLPYLALHFAVANVEYRLGRVSPAPAAVEDCRCALQWMIRHAKQYNVDPARIVVTGLSAGGHLALMTGMLPQSSPFDRSCVTEDTVRWIGASEPRLKVAAVINWFGITDVADLLEGPNARHYAVEWFGSMKDREELAREVSPLSYVRHDLPPILSIHGDADPIVPYTQAVRLHEALEKAGVPNRLITVHGGQHGGFSKEETARSYEAIWEFLRAHGVM